MKHKWVVEGLGHTAMSRVEREAYWASVHLDAGYENVVSLTEDRSVQDRIVGALRSLRGCERVLIPGCGSCTALQERLVLELPDVRIMCVDFPAVVDAAEGRFAHERVEYVSHDMARPHWRAEFDAVVVVNSILSDSDLENRQILASCHDALRPGGILTGFFPTAFAAFEAALILGDDARLALVDPATAIKYEPAQDAYQMFYTPLRLRQVLREAGFVRELLAIEFLDSEHFLGPARDVATLGEGDDDLVLYEHFVVAERSDAAAPIAERLAVRRRA
jgi:SAM-dependent methyltransferase